MCGVKFMLIISTNQFFNSQTLIDTHILRLIDAYKLRMLAGS
jgi:hypothetical protein